ncbi:MAG: MopE-related protein, partial [Deltaproteobacteria bacterium]|nr:MopE-related protein [Deltaproteobacteria bacterium]
MMDRLTRSALPWAGLLLLLAGAACSRSELGDRRCQDGVCPCVFEADCPEGFDCVDAVCVEKIATDAGPGKLGFGELCESNDRCLSGYCLPDLQGAFCTLPCSTGCPEGWACREVLDPRGEVESLGLCVVDRDVLCQACLEDADCNLSGGDRCLDADLDGLPGCARDCTFEPCPEGYHCTDVVMGEGEIDRQCLPDAGTCACGPSSEGQLRGCLRQNELGICSGQELCEVPGGWSECSAREPVPELCNGIDDDCEGRIDEGLEPRPCSATLGDWTCSGTETCAGASGWLCDAPLPEAERCDGADNNCDGVTDEDFVDDAGLYFQREHCGGCGIDCDAIIPHATATLCEIHEGAARCIATACEAGTFPYLEGTICLRLPDTLCQPCNTDDDCVAPGSHCIEEGPERFCGRDCAPGSAYGTTCPTGYACEPHAQGSQCQPTTDTCLCDADHLGTVRGCNVDFCQGYETCAASGGTQDWSSCDISAIVEICDELDNDCDGDIDEGYLNPATGRYDTDAHCGFCNNDCSAYWVPEIVHATGTCNAALPFPTCEMGACVTETVGGIDYEWVDVDGLPGNGCECRRVRGNTATDLPDRGAFPEPGSEYVDENCDGVDGVIGHALFVWGGRSGQGTGTMSDPFRTIRQALVAFPTSGKRYILVAEGVYEENLRLTEGMQLFGGYAPDFLSREITVHATTVQAGPPPAPASPGAMNLINVGHGAATTIVSGFHLLGRDVAPGTADDQDGAPSIAVYLRNVGPGVVFQNNVIRGGHAGAGGRGSTGAQGFGRQASAALDGRAGIDSVPVVGVCPATLVVAGGLAGRNTTCGQANGNPGGSAICPVFDWGASPVRGAQQAYSVLPLGKNGAGGHDWSYDDFSGPECSHATESGWPSSIQTNIGGDGLDGQDGSPGNGGGGCTGRYGSISGTFWVPSPAAGTAGGAGAIGDGGGGGGAGGGTARFASGGCQQHEQGASGGGGGAGGCGGRGGNPGGDGGASIAILAYFGAPTSAAGLPRITDNRIRRGPGGRGGDGGFGGPGGQGGNGAFGGF